MKYEIRFYQDNQYEVLEIPVMNRVFLGTLEEVNAWISLKEKGFDL